MSEYPIKVLILGFLESLIVIPKSIGLIIFSDLVSLISKCKCGPPELPEFPESAIISFLEIGKVLEEGNNWISKLSFLYCCFFT